MHVVALQDIAVEMLLVHLLKVVSDDLVDVGVSSHDLSGLFTLHGFFFNVLGG